MIIKNLHQNSQRLTPVLKSRVLRFRRKELNILVPGVVSLLTNFHRDTLTSRGRSPPSHPEHQHTRYQADAVPGAFGFSHLEVRGAYRTLCDKAANSQVCEYVRTWNANTLDIKRM